MNENLNLCEILKDVPEGYKLYSPLCGEVEFIEVIKKDTFSIKTSAYDEGYALYFTYNGRYLKDKGECLLFPSKEQRDWSKFEYCKFTKGELVLCSDDPDSYWNIRKFSNMDGLRYEVCNFEMLIAHTTYKYCEKFDGTLPMPKD